ncbi:Uncharacterised protein [Bifidobacterium longum subsp. infantis]|nr:Uncharacterised protein [Bifidobacterium longum subsp. infantis]
MYVIIPSMLLMFLIAGVSKKAKTIAFAIGTAIAVVMIIIIPKTVMPTLGIAPGGKQETIPFAIQQVAHDVKYNNKDITPQERKLISDFLTIDYKSIPTAYDPQIADPIKGTSLRNPELFNDFIKLGLRRLRNIQLVILKHGWGWYMVGSASPTMMVRQTIWWFALNPHGITNLF